MRRREFVAVMAGAVWPLAVQAQLAQQQRMPQIGVLWPDSAPSVRIEEFRQGMRDLDLQSDYRALIARRPGRCARREAGGGALDDLRERACRRVPRPALGRATRPSKRLVTMLREGELDAIIVGNEVPDDWRLRTVFPDPDAINSGTAKQCASAAHWLTRGNASQAKRKSSELS
jgi:hypothetical protein